MNLDHLRYAAQIERDGSITRAAKSLYMGQPNLSKAVRELETETGITIFRRNSRGVEPTELGARFLNYAKTILSQMDELESLYKPKDEQAFRFAVSVPRATYVTAGFTDFIRDVPPGVALDVTFKETSAMGAITDVVNGDSQLAVIRVPDQHADYYAGFLKNMRLHADLLWEFRMSLLMSERHPLACCSEIPYHMLDGYIEICHGDVQTPPMSFAQIRRGAKLQGQKRRIYIYERGSQFDLLKRVQGTYMWVSPVPIPILAENQLVLKECPLSAMHSRDYVIYQEDRRPTALEQTFVETVKRYTENILQ